jgi:hypothetical protein
MRFQSKPYVFVGFFWVLCLHLLGNTSVVAAQTGGLSAACAERTVCNGDFAQEFQYWSRYHAEAALVPGHSGQGMQVQWLDNEAVVYQVLPGVFAQGKTYEVTAWCKASAMEQCQLYLGDGWAIRDANNPSFENEVRQNVPSTGEWQQLRATLTLSRDERLQVALSPSYDGEGVLYDDLQIREVPAFARSAAAGFKNATTTPRRTPIPTATPEPATFILVGFGMLAAMWWRKRHQ